MNEFNMRPEAYILHLLVIVGQDRLKSSIEAKVILFQVPLSGAGRVVFTPLPLEIQSQKYKRSAVPLNQNNEIQEILRELDRYFLTFF